MATATPINFNANAVIEDAFLDLGVFMPGGTIPAADAQFALRALNKLASSLLLQPLTMPFTDREVFSVVAGTSTYSIGPGGNFDTIKPASIERAALLLPTSGATIGTTEIPLGILTDDAYQDIRQKSLQAPMFTQLAYNQTYASGLGEIFLYPTPNVTTYKLVIYRGDVIQGFANLTTFYDFPAGYYDLLQYGLEKRLAPSYGGTRWTPLLEAQLREAITLVKRQNSSLRDTALDDALVSGHRGGYDIYSGAGG